MTPSDNAGLIDVLPLSADCYFVLDGETVRPAETWGDLIRFFADPSLCQIDRTRINEETEVSTVFLILDLGFHHREGGSVKGRRDPVLFETMILGGDYNGRGCRSSTIEEARRTHKEMVALFFPKPSGDLS